MSGARSLHLGPSEAEALLWAASATGPGAFQKELRPPLGQAEAHLLAALVRKAITPPADDERRGRRRKGWRAAAGGPGGQSAAALPNGEVADL